MSKKERTNRGKPQEWTDQDLKQMALEVKYKLKGQKITPSLLQRETGVGRNTWSRRMKDLLEELNSPIIRSIPLNENNDINLPNIELIFEKYANNKSMLKNELLQLEVIIYQLYEELTKYKEELSSDHINYEEVQDLKEQLNKEKKRADHYEQLYNTIVASSLYPHLHDQSPLLKEIGIKDKLVKFGTNKERNLDLKDLSRNFPDRSEEAKSNDASEKTESKRLEILSKLKGKFDL
ncbi:hypothetical protein [Bacillus sp. FJAT-45350]|uniref:hypothetical protein n=1 Tax=Bacillus sp. FJAT-45350 TaxID=2011014 RepID=UPI000BB87438|nr:hypothetical protein [Bacillus sp. FJAT-45350]